MKQQMEQCQLRTQQQIDDLRAENEDLRSRLGKCHDVNEPTNETDEATNEVAPAEHTATDK